MKDRLVLVLLVAFMFVSLVHAQESTGALEGVILDSQGEAIVSVEIQISGPNLQGVRKTSSDEQGYFRVLALPVGTCTVRLTHLAFQEVVYESVAIRLGKTTTLGEVRLKQRVEEVPEITVTAEAPIIDPNSTSQEVNLEVEAYESLPVNRNFRSIISLTPQSNTSYYGDEVNISGSSGGENFYFIDGINVTDPVQLRTSTDLPYNFIQEIQIKGGGYEAEFGRALEGIVNVITRSGGNRFSGQLFGFFTNSSFAGDPREGLVKQNVDKFSTYDIGFSLGGPVIRDKLWFFLAYNPQFENMDVEIPGLGFHKDKKRAQLFAGKLTWQVSPKTNFVFTMLGDPTRHEKIGTTFAALLPAPAALSNPDPYLGEIKTGSINFSLRGRHIVNRNFFLEGSISHSRRKDSDGPLTDYGATEPFFFDTATGTFSGGYGRVLGADSMHTVADVSTSLFLGPHSLKAGLAFDYASMDGVFDNLAGPDGNSPSVIIRLEESLYFAVWSTQRSKVNNRVLSLFLQDSWLVNKRLRLNLGLRWDGQYFVGEDGKLAQRITDQWQPRIGFNYQLGEIGSQRIFGSIGRFYEQIPLFMTWAMYSNSIYQDRMYMHDPRIDPSGGFILDVSSGINPETPGLRGQYFDELTLGYEKQIGRAFRARIRGMYRTLRLAVEDIYDPVSGGFIVVNPGRGDADLFEKFTRTYTALELTFEKPRGRLNFLVSYVLSRSQGNYPGLFNADYGIPAPNISPVDFPGQLINATGRLPNDRPHVFKAYGSYYFPVGLTVGTFFILQTGTPLNEFGGSIHGPEFKSFLSERGTVGRTPSIWDWNIRLTYDLARLTRSPLRTRLVLDIFHLFSRREALLLDQAHYLGIDDEGNQVGENPNYLLPTLYQAPMTIRLGFEINF